MLFLISIKNKKMYLTADYTLDIIQMDIFNQRRKGNTEV